MRFEFLVNGSAPEPYIVTFIFDAKKGSGNCTCPAGQKRQICKHRIWILEGDLAKVVPTDETAYLKFKVELVGTDIETTFLAYKNAVAESAHAEKYLQLTKSTLARTMNS